MTVTPAFYLKEIVKESTHTSIETAVEIITAGRVTIDGVIASQPELIVALPADDSPKVAIDSTIVEIVHS